MEQFIIEYGFQFQVFQEMILKTESLFAGSAALALYLKENGINTVFLNDVELFTTEKHMETIIDFLMENGYLVFERPHQILQKTTNEFICTNTNDKCIELFVVSDSYNTLDFVLCNTVLSICASWWNAKENMFNTLSPSDTLSMDMYICQISLQNTDLDEYVERQIKMFTECGFNLFPPPRPSITYNKTDMREIMEENDCKLIGKTVFDIEAYDDVSAILFLKSSPNNILIEQGEHLHGYNRLRLHDAVRNRYRWYPYIGYVYTTPIGHNITHLGMDVLLYSDYTVFRFDENFTVPINEYDTVNMSTVYCYTLLQYLNKDACEFVSPLQQLIEPHPAEDDEDDVEMEMEDVEMPPDSPILHRENGYENV